MTPKEAFRDSDAKLYFWLEQDQDGRVYLWHGAYPDKSEHPCIGTPVRDLLECWSGYEAVIGRRYEAWNKLKS
jgi:hypothetical protein